MGLCVLAPHPQLLQYTLLACGAYALFLAFSAVDGEVLPRRTAIRRLAAALGAVVVGLAIGAVHFLPVREYVSWSPRAGGLADYGAATSYAWPPEELLNAYLPQFSGMLNNYWGRNGIHLHSDYVGAVVLMQNPTNEPGKFHWYFGLKPSINVELVWYICPSSVRPTS